MTVKEYLSQAYRLDQRINSKIEQIELLNSLAAKCTATISDMPRNSNCGSSGIEGIILKIIELQQEINCEIDKLVDLKAEIMKVIRAVQKPEYQILLEMHYLCFKTWEEIAQIMNCSVDNIFKLRRKALKNVVLPESLQ